MNECQNGSDWQVESFNVPSVLSPQPERSIPDIERRRGRRDGAGSTGSRPGTSGEGAASAGDNRAFFPEQPTSLREVGLPESLLIPLILKTILHRRMVAGRQIAEQLKLPFALLRDMLDRLRNEKVIVHIASAPMSDDTYELSPSGSEKARQYAKESTYFGAAPVSLKQYSRSVDRQSIRRCRPRLPDVAKAFDDLVVSDAMISQIGQAIHAGRGLFLYGASGNGKTSIAERIACAVGPTIWIPRAIHAGGEVIRLFDPNNHHEVPLAKRIGQCPVDNVEVDRRWVRIRRPTVVAGGELQLSHLEICCNPISRVNEATIQLKSNCGVLVIDDFGRQRVSVAELLNRWIVPLEKAYDYVSLPSGRQIAVPFDQLLVFSTNLEPRVLVDDAFLRRIPYKVEVQDPTDSQFRGLFRMLAYKLGCKIDEQTLAHLVEVHFIQKNRPLRYCYVRDLLLQVKNYCEFHEQPFVLTAAALDNAVSNYFATI